MSENVFVGVQSRGSGQQRGVKLQRREELKMFMKSCENEKVRKDLVLKRISERVCQNVTHGSFI